MSANTEGTPARKSMEEPVADAAATAPKTPVQVVAVPVVRWAVWGCRPRRL